MELISEPGKYQMPEQQYHSDPCVEPSLSSSVAKVLLERSPRHAWVKHARLGRASQAWSKRLNMGSAIHDILLRGEENSVVWCDFPDFRTKEAREVRDEAESMGLIPILAKDEYRITQIVDAIRREWGDAATYEREQVFCWKEGDSWCRSMIDLSHPQGQVVFDVKSTDLEATPEGWVRTQMWDYLFQVGFYRRAMEAIHDEPNAIFMFLVVEQTAPYGVMMVEPDEGGYELADKLASKAIQKWQFLSAKGWEAEHWPNYPSGVYRPLTPTWVMRRWEEL